MWRRVPMPDWLAARYERCPVIYSHYAVANPHNACVSASLALEIEDRRCRECPRVTDLFFEEEVRSEEKAKGQCWKEYPREPGSPSWFLFVSCAFARFRVSGKSGLGRSYMHTFAYMGCEGLAPRTRGAPARLPFHTTGERGRGPGARGRVGARREPRARRSREWRRVARAIRAALSPGAWRRRAAGARPRRATRWPAATCPSSGCAA